MGFECSINRSFAYYCRLKKTVGDLRSIEWAPRVCLILAGRKYLVSAALFFLSGCSLGESKHLAGNLYAVNHTSADINRFSVNGYGSTGAGPYGYGGGSCCVLLPRKWTPGIKFLVEWETNPFPGSSGPFPGFKNREKFLAWKNVVVAGFRQHSTVIDLPEYEDRLCALEVHFLPCNEIKVSTSCWSYPSPNSPIKEPQEMPEPAVCPK